MYPYLVDILRCPWDRSVLRIDDAVLRCSGCDRKYPIDRGIPRFVDPEALCNEQVGDLAARDFTRKPIALRIDDLPEFDAIRSALSHRKIKVGLDAGSGAGKVTPVLANAGQTIAMDLAFEGLIRFVGREQYRHLDLVNGDITRIPFRDELADTVVCSQVIQHIPNLDMRQQTIRELRRVLLPGGRLVLSGYHLWSGQPQQEGHHDNGIYFHRMTKDELHRDLSPYFRILKISGARIQLPKTYRFVRMLGKYNVTWERLVAPLPFAFRHAAAFVAVCEAR